MLLSVAHVHSDVLTESSETRCNDALNQNEDRWKFESFAILTELLFGALVVQWYGTEKKRKTEFVRNATENSQIFLNKTEYDVEEVDSSHTECKTRRAHLQNAVTSKR